MKGKKSYTLHLSEEYVKIVEEQAQKAGELKTRRGRWLRQFVERKLKELQESKEVS